MGQFSSDASALWNSYQNLSAQFTQIIAEKSAVLTAIGALQSGNEPDFSSIAEAGEGGSASYSIVSLQARFDSLVRSEAEVFGTMERTRILAIKAEPDIFASRVSVSRPACGVFNAGP